MKLQPPKSVNYSATVVAVPAIVDLPGLDNLVGIPALGHQALTTRGIEVGDLRIAFTAETALSEEYACENDLHRDPELNKTNEKGYLERNRRVRALKLRGHVSNALLMPLESVAYTGVDTSQLNAGDTFDVLNGHEICKKYEIPTRGSTRSQSRIEKAFKRVDEKIFPRHLETSQYWRAKHELKLNREVVITQKLHGCLWRGGRVPVLRKLTWREKVARWFGVRIDDYEFDVVFGSNRVIKDAHNPDQRHFYGHDLWTEYGQRVEDLIPEGVILYGELIGWTKNADGEDIPIQRNYTYNQPQGQCELYVYRVAHVNQQGFLSDLPWDGVKEFCTARGLKWVPELVRLPMDVDPESGDEPTYWIDDLWDRIADTRYADGMANAWDDWPGWNEPPLAVSSHKTVDEGICLRQEGLVPTILKLKSPAFLEHETKLLDSGDADVESAA